MTTLHSSTPERFDTVSFSYADWRQRFLTLILRGASIGGLFVAIFASIDTPPFLVALYAISYLTVLVITFAPLSYRVRAISFLAVIMAMAIASLLETSIRADARLFLLAFVVLAAMLFGERAGVAAVGISLIPVAIIGVFTVSGQYTIISVTIGGIQNGLTWIVATLVLLLIETLLLIGLSMLQRGFDAALQQSQQLLEVVQEERATLEQRVKDRTEQLRVSADVGRTAASVLRPDDLLRNVVNLITDRFGHYYAAIFVIDASGRNAVLREATGEAGRILKERGHQLEVNGQSMVGYAITRRHSRIALDVGEEAVRFANPLLPDTRSEIALPLIIGDRVLGALDVQSKQEAAFDEASATVLQSMADQIAIAWNNALSYAASEAIARRSRALFAASREVGHVQTDLAETIRLTMQAAAEALDYDHWCVLTFNEIRTALIPIAVHDWPDAAEALDVQTRLDHPLVASLQSGAELFVTEAHDARLPRLGIDGLSGVIGVPIKTRDTVVGVLAVTRTHGSELTGGDLEVGRSLASLIAVAIENHNLVETNERTLREMDEINRTLTGQSWERFVRRQDQREIIWVSQSDHMQPQQLPEVSEALTQGHIVTRAMQDAQQLGVAVPIKLRDVPVGALRLIVPKRTWNPEMAAALDSIAGHVAQAAENARLIAETEQRFTRERALAEATEKVRQRGEIEAVLQTAATELARYLNASHIAVRLSPERSPANDDGR